MSNEDPFPYNLPPWRREHEEVSPDGRQVAKVHLAWELNMSGPTYGKLFVGDTFRIENCNPTFKWSEDSRYVAVPKWIGSLWKRERLLVLDLHEMKIYTSRKKWGLLVVDGSSGGVISLTNSPHHKPKQIRVPMEEVRNKYTVSTDLLQGTEDTRPKEVEYY